MKTFVTAACLLASATSVVGHSMFQQLWVGSVDKAGTCARTVPSNSPVTSVSSTDIRCNVGGTKGVSGLCPITAGDNVTVEMHAQPGDRSCKNEAIGGNHFGPVIIYMSKVANAQTNAGAGSWFKIDEEGYNPTTKKWGTDSLNANCGKRSFKVPSTLAPGDYLLRAEAIALHAASSSGGAQFYMTCFQVTLNGTGKATPAGVTFPGAYKASDPGIMINIYNAITNYVIPGPAVYKG
ncbi:glycoside hydrolase family 61 protein [Leptodontidium sp. MPI-SDFR-AT-0119]|nr:glycoside hydrolase family 61 protein [Leptodontidium sp. MPI-SDFR-AT-0119]